MPTPLEIPRPGSEMPEVPSCAPLGYVHSLETFGLVDGPGVRYVVIMQGCMWRCLYCHNPETWELEGGAQCSAEDLFNKAWRYHNYWSNNGGVTVGGGEPLLQMEFVTGFFKLLKERGVHTALDTAGGPFRDDEAWQSKFKDLMNVTDLVLLDFKQADPKAHIRLTGKSNSPTIDMAKWLSSHGKDMWIRHVLVPGLTDSENDLLAIRQFADSLETVKRIEILPYNMMAQLKWEEKGFTYPLIDTDEPTAEQIVRAEKILGAK